MAKKKSKFRSARSSSSAIAAPVIEEVTIIETCLAENLTRLEGWARQGVRVQSSSPLSLAVDLCSLDVIGCLVKELGADVNQEQHMGILAMGIHINFTIPALAGRFDAKRKMVEDRGSRSYSDAIEAINFGASPLYIVAQQGSVKKVRYLVMELGADVEKGNKEGVTPLIIAAQEGHLEVVRLLVKELGADVNRASHDGHTPVSVCAKEGHLELLRYLVEELGANANPKTQDGSTPISTATWEGRFDVIKCLAMELDADVNDLHYIDGTTPLHIAVCCGHLQIVRDLVERFNANKNHASHDGTTPLILATRGGFYDITRYLIMELDADINQANNAGVTPLMFAAQMNNQAILMHLVHKGACIKTVSTAGTAAEMLKAAGGSAAEVAYLKVRECCSNPGCNGGGAKRCAVCKQTRYCGMACRVAHWPMHRVGCCRPARRISEMN
jgi:ankyrin repeat protein